MVSCRGLSVSGEFLKRLGAVAALTLAPNLARAQDITGQPTPGEWHFQRSVTPIMDSIVAFHDHILIWVISFIVVLVFALLAVCILRFNARANPVPSKTTHNTLIEVAWTVLPLVILFVIAIPSFGVLTDQLTVPDGVRKYLGANLFDAQVDVPAADLTVKATGQQWYWNYEYVDAAKTFDSNILHDAERATLKPGQPRLLAVDNELVVPVDTTVRMQITSDPSGVIHAFAVPSFGIKIDAVPGRLNETWFNARETGVFYGQCSELCGKDHAFMPIAVRVVSKQEFATWMAAFKAGDYASASTTLAAIQ